VREAAPRDLHPETDRAGIETARLEGKENTLVCPEGIRQTLSGAWHRPSSGGEFGNAGFKRESAHEAETEVFQITRPKNAPRRAAMKVTKLQSGGELIEFTQVEMDEMQGRIAAEAGMTLEAYRAMLNEHMTQDWCKCGDLSEGVGAFCDDSAGSARQRNQHCVSKHHWHCATCDKLIQVG
jgi:hypothetical protein